MRSVLLSIPLILAASSSFAQELPNSLTMSCAAASELVRQRGQVVIASGPDLYGRFVSGPGYCDADQTIEPSWIPTADQSQCLVGYRCQERIDHSK